MILLVKKIIAKVLIFLGKYPSSKKIFSASLKLFPENLFLLKLYARMCINLRFWEDSLLALEKISKQKNDYKELDYQIARAKFYLGDVSGACSLLLEKKEKGEILDNQVELFGVCLTKLGKLDEAIVVWEHALSINEHNSRAREWQIRILARQKQYSKLEKILSTIEYQNENVRTEKNYLILAKAYEAAGKIRYSEGVYHKCLGQFGERYSVCKKLAEFYFKLGLYGKAFYWFKKCGPLGALDMSIARKLMIINDLSESVGFDIDKYIAEKGSKVELIASAKAVEGIINRSLNADDSDYLPIKRRVAVIISSLGSGGAERQCVNLVNGLASLLSSRVESVHLLCTNLTRSNKDRFYVDKVDNSKVQINEYLNRDQKIDFEGIAPLRSYADLIKHIQPLYRQKAITSLVEAFSIIRPEIVHGWLDDTFINVAIAASIVGVPLVVGRWGSLPPGFGRKLTERGELDALYKQKAYREIRRLPNIRFTCNSAAAAKEYASWIDVSEQDIEIIYNGLELESLLVDHCGSESLKVQLGIPSSGSVVGTIFRFGEEKRPHLWVDAAEKIAIKLPDVHFVMVGDGPMREEVQQHIDDIGLTHRIHLVGRQENVGSWYGLMDVLLMTSRVEGVSNVALEAQAMGVPVVLPNVGGLSEAVCDGSTGWLVDEPTSDNLAVKVISILSDKNWRDKASPLARRFVEEKFHPSLQLERTLSVYGFD